MTEPRQTLHPPFAAYRGDEPFVFISYSHRDSERVYAELDRLHRAGTRIWYDEGIAPSQEWPDEIARAIQQCAVFVVFLSPEAVASRHVRKEIHFALDQHKPFLPVHLSKAEFPPGLQMQLGDIQAIIAHEDGTDGRRYREKLHERLQGTGVMRPIVVATAATTSYEPTAAPVRQPHQTAPVSTPPPLPPSPTHVPPPPLAYRAASTDVGGHGALRWLTLLTAVAVAAHVVLGCISCWADWVSLPTMVDGVADYSNTGGITETFWRRMTYAQTTAWLIAGGLFSGWLVAALRARRRQAHLESTGGSPLLVPAIAVWTPLLLAALLAFICFTPFGYLKGSEATPLVTLTDNAQRLYVVGDSATILAALFGIVILLLAHRACRAGT